MGIPWSAKTLLPFALATLLTSSVWGDNQMIYRDADRTADALRALAASSANARVFTIGTSTDYATDAANPANYPILAIRISGDT